MGKKSSPPPPDYTALAKEQGTINKETGLDQWKLQNTTVQTPYGQRQLVADPNEPSGYRIVESLTPEDQARLDQGRQVQSGMLGLAPGALDYLSGMIGKPIDTSKLPPMVSGVDTSGRQMDLTNVGNIQRDISFAGAPGVSSGEATRNRVEKALMDRYNAFAEPQNEQDKSALNTRIANMGGLTTSTAGRRMVSDLLKSQAQARQEAGYGAIEKGGAEATREFGMDMQGRQQAVQELLSQAGLRNESQQQAFDQMAQAAGFKNSAVGNQIADMFNNASLANASRSQGIQENLNLRQAPLNELMALLGGTQVAPMQFTGGGSASWQPANIYGAGKDQYSAAVADANAKKAGTSSMLSGLFSLGGAALGGPMGASIGKSLFG